MQLLPCVYKNDTSSVLCCARLFITSPQWNVSIVCSSKSLVRSSNLIYFLRLLSENIGKQFRWSIVWRGASNFKTRLVHTVGEMASIATMLNVDCTVEANILFKAEYFENSSSSASKTFANSFLVKVFVAYVFRWAKVIAKRRSTSSSPSSVQISIFLQKYTRYDFFERFLRFLRISLNVRISGTNDRIVSKQRGSSSPQPELRFSITQNFETVNYFCISNESPIEVNSN